MRNPDVPFESAKLLIARAKEHSAEFDARYKAFLITRPYDVISEKDEKSGHLIMKVKLTQQLPSELRAVYSDALNNLRAALDHAVNEAAVQLRGGARNCYFPFGQNAAAFALIYDSKRYKTVPVDLRPHLNSLQPYFGGDRLLYALGKITGPLKHQLVLRMDATGTEVELANLRGERFHHILPLSWNRAKGELPVLSVEPGGEVYTDVRFTPSVHLDDRAVDGLFVDGLLSDAFEAKAASVVDGIEAETWRLLRERDNGHGAASP